jgi:choline dehydrogenase-like flavoprotein
MNSPDIVDFDAIVIGSGISGGWAAKELTEKGLKVLMIDRGRMVEHGTDYITEGKGPWELPFNGTLPPEDVARTKFIQQHAGGADVDRAHFYVDDSEVPYSHETGKPFHWIRPSGFGGKSVIWGRVSLRMGPQDFSANKVDGHGVDWPIRYDDLAPWYDYVEDYAGISGSSENIPHLPDGIFQKPHDLSAGDLWLKANIEAKNPGRKVIPIRTANMTEDKPEQNRSKCQRRFQCWRGCSFGAYFSTQAVTLPPAMATGRLKVLTDQVVSSLDYDPATKRVTGVRAIDTKSMTQTTYRARIVFLCASAMASMQILLNSRIPGTGQSVFNSSGVLGSYVMDHIFKAGVNATLPVGGNLIAYGRTPAGSYIPRFRNLNGPDMNGRDEDVNFLRGYAYQGGSERHQSAPVGFGAEMKKGLRTYGEWNYGNTMFGECLPYKDNIVSLDAGKKDRFGIPLAKFDVTFRDNEMRMVEDSQVQIVKMLKAAGASNIQTYRKDHIPGEAIHELGGAPMGKDPTGSVLNKWSQAHDALNLFVTDGASMSSGSCVNPSLTLMALTARAADYAVKQVRDGML